MYSDLHYNRCYEFAITDYSTEFDPVDAESSPFRQNDSAGHQARFFADRQKAETLPH